MIKIYFTDAVYEVQRKETKKDKQIPVWIRYF